MANLDSKCEQEKCKVLSTILPPLYFGFGLKPSTSGSFVILVILLLLTTTMPAFSGNAYWFQVGVFANIGSVNVTGASVQIRTHVVLPNNPQAYTSFWVGLNLPNNAFIQVGYVSWGNVGGYPQRYWEYYPPTTASKGGGVFHGDYEGDEVGPNGTWYTYSLQSYGNVWSAYINGILDGSVNLGTSNSGGNTPYVVAEVSDTFTTHIILGPAEFRNLAYRDTNNVWHSVPSAEAYVGLGEGSGTLPSGVSNPYGLQVLGTNDWMAGSGLPQTYNGATMWSASATTTQQSQTYSEYTPQNVQTYSSNTVNMETSTPWVSPQFQYYLAIGLWAVAIVSILVFVWYFFHSRRPKSIQIKLDSVFVENHTQSLTHRPSQESTMFCNQCGSKITRDSKFCKECGSKQS